MQQTDAPDIGDSVEVIVAGPSSLANLWSYDGCQGLVIARFQQKGEWMATVKIGVAAGGRSGKQWFPVSMLKKV